MEDPEAIRPAEPGAFVLDLDNLPTIEPVTFTWYQQALADIILWFVDRYTDVTYLLSVIRERIRVKMTKLRQNRRPKVKCLYAHIDGKMDITSIMSNFYRWHKRQTAPFVKQWLEKFGIEGNLVVVIYVYEGRAAEMLIHLDKNFVLINDFTNNYINVSSAAMIDPTTLKRETPQQGEARTVSPPPDDTVLVEAELII